ncbi:uncharacterized protein ASCRUDRAFT_77905, partial [Ascoidea rubescens DSM 1968]
MDLYNINPLDSNHFPLFSKSLTLQSNEFTSLLPSTKKVNEQRKRRGSLPTLTNFPLFQSNDL